MRYIDDRCRINVNMFLQQTKIQKAAGCVGTRELEAANSVSNSCV